ncbi:MAG: thiol-disulfide isomerase/thioredoxin [Glaciecola sp.]|jgi:thiol-disulfide isomerase/thioredoxin|uniref:TlpA family protein disulfide reductase n=1 Tax=Congregibacter sp. TaxID=2744308 RepID=UPI0039E5EB7C
MKFFNNTTANWLRGAILLLLIAGMNGCDKPGSQDPSSLDSAGSWTFVNYWAEWCKPCIKEIPELNLLHKRDGVRVLGVNYDGAQGEDLQSQLDSLNVQFPTLSIDPAARYGIDRPQVLPTTLVIDPEGNVVAVLVGPQTEHSLLEVAGLTNANDHSAESIKHSGDQ